MKYIVMRWKVPDHIAEDYRNLLIKLLVEQISTHKNEGIEFKHLIVDVYGE